MSPPLNMTPLRKSVLRFLADKPKGYNPKGLVRELAPRSSSSGHTYHWTQQGAARMAGKLVNPLIAAGLIRDADPLARMCDRVVRITDAGRAALAQHDEAASNAEREAAIRSGA